MSAVYGRGQHLDGVRRKDRSALACRRRAVGRISVVVEVLLCLYLREQHDFFGSLRRTTVVPCICSRLVRTTRPLRDQEPPHYDIISFPQVAARGPDSLVAWERGLKLFNLRHNVAHCGTSHVGCAGWTMLQRGKGSCICFPLEDLPPAISTTAIGSYGVAVRSTAVIIMVGVLGLSDMFLRG